MSAQEIETALTQLSRDEREQVRAWLDRREAQARERRGLCAGQFTVPDDFDAPLPKDLLRDFEDNASFLFRPLDGRGEAA